MATKYLIRNNSVRDIGFSGRICRAGAGCPTPPHAMRLIPGLVLDPLFPLSATETFKSYRGIIASMSTRLPNGEMEVDVLADGIEPKLTIEQFGRAMDEHRQTTGFAKPVTREDTMAELERTMARNEDPMERHHRVQREHNDQRMIQMVVDVMGKNIQAQIEAAVAKKLDELTAAESPAAPGGDKPRTPVQAPVPARR